MGLTQKVTIIKAGDAKVSKQVADDQFNVEIQPRIGFANLAKVYENNYMMGGIVKKLRKALLTKWFSEKKEVLDLMNSTDWETILTNLFVCGNAFIEVIETGSGNIESLIPVRVSETIKVLKGGDGFKQSISKSNVYFNKRIKTSERPKAKETRVKSGAKDKELLPNEKSNYKCGFNDKINSMLHISLSSITSNYYGDSYFSSVITQLALLTLMDQYYENFFDNATIKNMLLSDKNGTLSKEDRQVLQEFIKNDLKGLKNSFSTAVINGDIQKIVLGEDIDANAFNNLRDKLEQAVAIGLDIPYDLLKPTNSNKASSTTAMDQFYDNTVSPYQNILVSFFKNILEDNSLELESIDTSNKKENGDYLATMVDSGILTPNEARAEVGFAKVAGGDELRVRDSKQQQNQDATGIQKKYNIYKKLKEVEDDIGTYLGQHDQGQGSSHSH